MIYRNFLSIVFVVITLHIFSLHAMRQRAREFGQRAYQCGERLYQGGKTKFGQVRQQTQQFMRRPEVRKRTGQTLIGAGTGAGGAVAGAGIYGGLQEITAAEQKKKALDQQRRQELQESQRELVVAQPSNEFFVDLQKHPRKLEEIFSLRENLELFKSNLRNATPGDLKIITQAIESNEKNVMKQPWTGPILLRIYERLDELFGHYEIQPEKDEFIKSYSLLLLRNFIPLIVSGNEYTYLFMGHVIWDKYDRGRTPPPFSAVTSEWKNFINSLEQKMEEAESITGPLLPGYYKGQAKLEALKSNLKNNYYWRPGMYSEKK